MAHSKLMTGADLGATILRISLGTMYLAHAYLKFFTFSLSGTAQFFESVGFPGWTAYPVAGAEVFAGIALILGWHARWVALALIPILLGATMTHWGNGWVFTGQGGGWEYPVFLIIASLIQALLGNGAFALSSERRGVQSRNLPRVGRRHGY